MISPFAPAIIDGAVSACIVRGAGLVHSFVRGGRKAGSRVGGQLVVVYRRFCRLSPQVDKPRTDGGPAGYVGRRAARLAFTTAGLAPADVDVCEFYDPFSFEIIRQFEAFEFCGEGEGGDFVMDGRIGHGGEFPVTTDGGTMSFGHAGRPQMMQRVARGVHQLQNICETNQVHGAEVAMCSCGGSGAPSSIVTMAQT